MPTSVAIGFPWGRYHATPWGRHVNEAAVEWPPSPWRLLRAFYATWQARCPALEPALVHGLLGSLSTPPSFVLPAAVGEAHTRHFMPDSSDLGKAGRSTDKAFDAFAVLECGAEVVVTWPVDLDPEQREALAQLSSLIPYFGRAESVCHARLLGTREAIPEGVTCRPIEVEPEAAQHDRPPTRVLVPALPLDVETLRVRTPDVRGQGRLDPPGSRWALYEPVAPEVAPMSSRPPAPRRASVTAARWAVIAPAQPSIRAAVAMGDILRRACLSRFGKLNDDQVSARLAGKRGKDQPLLGHGHAHYLATDDDLDGLIDHLTVWAPDGLDEGEVAAIVRVDRLSASFPIPDFRPVRMALEGVGDVAAVAPALVGPAQRWASATPFAPARHQHKNQEWVDHVRQSVTDELRWRGMRQPDDILLIQGPWLDFRRHRPTTDRLGEARRAVGVELRFDEPVSGPITIGALSHFGLGLFLPQGDDRPAP